MFSTDELARSENYQELMIVCKHSYKNGDWGSILNNKFSHPPTRFKGGCWLCEVCKEAIGLPRNEVDKAVFTDFAIGAREALEMGRLPNRPEIFFVPDLTTEENSIDWTPELIKDTKLVYDKDELHSYISTLLAKRGR